MNFRQTLLCHTSLATLPLAAQQINLSLHTTAVPDSFEVRATSTGPVFDLLPSAVFTLRWELSSDGITNNSDVRRSCGAYTLLNYGGAVDIGPYRYFTLVVMGDRNLSAAGCAITTAGMSIGGVRIRELNGCRNVALVQNAFTGLNNLDYFFSIGGTNVTGTITSAPISAGNCPPCEPPAITNTTSAPIPYCGVGVDLAVTATGSMLDHAWYKPNWAYLGWLPHIVAPTQPAGLYTVVVSNACGADTAQVEAAVDPDLCTPPVIDSAWSAPFGPSGINLYTAVSSSCAALNWVMPWGATVSASLTQPLQVNGPAPGLYNIIATNACGSDTFALQVVPPPNCTLPNITSATISTADPCVPGNVTFAAQVTGPGTMYHAWSAPNGTLLTGVPNFTMGFAPWGTYTYVASNFCGSDTIVVFHGGADTTGLAACVPPVIQSLSVAPVACRNDTLHLVAAYTNEGICADVSWSNVTVLSTIGDTTLAVASNTTMIRFTASNACGQTTMEAPVEVHSALEMSRQFCGPPAVPASLDSIMQLAHSFGGGQWWYLGQPHGGHYDPSVDTTGSYYYAMEVAPGLSCNVLRLRIREFVNANAGSDSSIVVCASDPPFVMLDMLGGHPDPSGSWQFGNASTDGTFDPMIDPPGTYRYFKVVYPPLAQPCADSARLFVHVDPLLTWYTDTDSDGLGDPLDSVLSCYPVDGYIPVAGDACPQVSGTVGDPCDDGDPETSDDVITAACTCAGELGIGMPERGSDQLALWPNPNRGSAFFLRPSSTTGMVHITLTDATGRVIHRSSRPASTAPLEVQLPSAAAAGTYFVGIVDDMGSAVLRMVVE